MCVGKSSPSLRDRSRNKGQPAREQSLVSKNTLSASQLERNRAIKYRPRRNPTCPFCLSALNPLAIGRAPRHLLESTDFLYFRTYPTISNKSAQCQFSHKCNSLPGGRLQSNHPGRTFQHKLLGNLLLLLQGPCALQASVYRGSQQMN